MSARILSAEAEREWIGQGLLDDLPLIVLMAARNAVKNASAGRATELHNPLDLPEPMLETAPVPSDADAPDRRAIYAAKAPALVAGYVARPEDAAFVEKGRALGVPEDVLELVGDLLLIERLVPDIMAEVIVEDAKRRKPMKDK